MTNGIRTSCSLTGVGREQEMRVTEFTSSSSSAVALVLVVVLGVYYGR